MFLHLHVQISERSALQDNIAFQSGTIFQSKMLKDNVNEFL